MEDWRPIAGFPGYQVSNLGRVQSFRKNGLFGTVLKQTRGNRNMRALVTLYLDAKPNYRLVARLVCAAFHGEPPTPQHQAAHIDGNIFDDTSGNLAWKTPKQNCEDRNAHGRTQRGETHYAAILTETQVKDIRKDYAERKAAGRVYGSVRDLSTAHAVSIGTIEDIIYSRNWRHI